MKIRRLCTFTALLRIFLAALLLPVTATLSGSCDTLNAAETKQAKSKNKKKKKTKKSPENKVLLPPEDSFDWISARELAPGIIYSPQKVSKPRDTRFHFIRVDLTAPGIGLRNNGRAENWGKPMPDFPKRMIRTKRVKVRDFLDQSLTAEEKNKSGFVPVLAVNASPWGPWQPPFNHIYADPPGVIICNGEIVSRKKKAAHAIVQYQDGKVELKTVGPKDPIDNIRLALTGFDFVLRDGKVVKSTRNGLAPRTAFGLSQDKRFLYILVVDGRQPGFSMGCSYEELGRWLLHLGASDGINMDGGGSTTLAFARKGRRRSTLLNRPSDKNERKVATVLVIGHETK